MRSVRKDQTAVVSKCLNAEDHTMHRKLLNTVSVPDLLRNQKIHILDLTQSVNKII